MSMEELALELAKEAGMTMVPYEEYTWTRDSRGWTLRLLPEIDPTRPRSFLVSLDAVRREINPDLALLCAWQHRFQKKSTLAGLEQLGKAIESKRRNTQPTVQEASILILEILRASGKTQEKINNSIRYMLSVDPWDPDSTNSRRCPEYGDIWAALMNTRRPSGAIHPERALLLAKQYAQEILEERPRQGEERSQQAMQELMQSPKN